jgi:predicted Zn-dependent protease
LTVVKVSASALLSLFLLPALPAAGASAQDIEHSIPPGYEPEEARDEEGIWLEMLEYEEQLKRSPLLVRDDDINDYLRNAACRVAGEYCRDIRVYLVRNPGFNASMAPTGMMEVWTGLLVRMRSTDELAAVLGHEVAHYTRLHSLERFRRLKSQLAAGTILDLGLILYAGVSTPVGQMMAMLSSLAYSRNQETEADLLGAQLMANADMDPHAAYEVWEALILEEEAAEVKRDDPGIFFSTHPDPVSRYFELREWIASKYGPAQPEIRDADRHVEILNAHYLSLMEDQLDTNRFGRTEDILSRHAAMGIEEGLLSYFLGEMYRQRNQEGDRQLAMDAYLQSVASGAPPPEAYKNLGYLYLRADQLDLARENFTRYLEVQPDATDRAMIEFYLE